MRDDEHAIVRMHPAQLEQRGNDPLGELLVRLAVSHENDRRPHAG